MTQRHTWYEPISMFYKNNRLASLGGIIVIIFLLMGLFAPLFAPYNPYKIDLRNALLPPGGEHVLGTDHQGRDLLSRIIYGARISLGDFIYICHDRIGYRHASGDIGGLV